MFCCKFPWGFCFINVIISRSDLDLCTLHLSLICSCGNMFFCHKLRCNLLVKKETWHRAWKKSQHCKIFFWRTLKQITKFKTSVQMGSYNIFYQKHVISNHLTRYSFWNKVCRSTMVMRISFDVVELSLVFAFGIWLEKL